MTQAGRAGRAAIEIVGDVSRLGRQLERDTQRAVNDIDLDTSNLSEQIGDAFTDGVEEAIDSLSELNPAVVLSSKNFVDRFTEASEVVAEAFGDMGDRIGDSFDHSSRASDRLFAGIGDGARDAGEEVRSGFLRPLTAGFGRLGEVISSAGSALVSLALTGTNPLGLVTLTLIAAAVAAAIPVVIALAAALADLVGIVAVLPGAIGVLASALIVGIVAFNGFGDAIGAVLEGDPEKIAEALERLAPAAQQVVREFERVLPIFRDVGKEIQQGFFVQLNGILERFGTATLPRVSGELRELSARLGDALAGMASLLTESQNIGILERLFASTGRIADTLGGAFRTLGQAFLEAIDAGLPSLEVLSDRLAGALTTFANFLSTSIADGSFQTFLDDAIATLDELLALGGAVGELLGVLFTGTDEAGRGFIGTLTDITKRFTEFFKSAEGQDAIEDFGEITAAVGIILGFVANVTRDLIDIFTDLDDAVNATGTFFVDIGRAISSFWTGLVSVVSGAAKAVGDFFSGLGSGIAHAWNIIVTVVSGAIDRVVSFISGMPGRIATFIESIPARIAAFFEATVDNIINILGTMIALVIVFFTDMPGQVVGALRSLVDLVIGAFNAAKTAITDAFTNIGAFIASVPSLLAAGWAAIVAQVTDTYSNIKAFVIQTWEDILGFFAGLGPRIGAFFQQATDAVVSKVSAMVEYVKSLPDRIRAAIGNLGSLLYNAGANVIQGLIDGIGSRIGQLRDKIASAVQTIRDHLPFSPAKTGPLSGSGSPERAGAIIGSMIAAGLDSQLALITGAAGRAAAAAGIPLSPLGEAGVTPLTTPQAGQSGTALSPVSDRTDEQVVVLVTIGGEDVDAIIDKRVEAAVSTEVRRLVAGIRGA